MTESQQSSGSRPLSGLLGSSWRMLTGSSPSSSSSSCASCPPSSTCSSLVSPGQDELLQAEGARTSFNFEGGDGNLPAFTATRPDANKPAEEQIWSVFLSDRYRRFNFSGPQELANMPAWVGDPQRLAEGCFLRGAGAGIMGYGLGLMLGGFFHSMQPIDMAQYQHLSTKEQIRISYKGFGPACTRMGRNFSKVGLVYSATECMIEKERGCHELANAVYAGCATGGFLAIGSGPVGMLTGCAGFAAFSFMIEQFMGHHA
ncbi:unnamed protein product [Amoebophrya sp. A25]|nr:unnamed protein product [Amoebophrya sp. A25]|eukprot:GSA25T00011398001.1